MNSELSPSSYYHEAGNLGAAAYGTAAIGTNQHAMTTGGIMANPDNYKPMLGGKKNRNKRMGKSMKKMYKKARKAKKTMKKPMKKTMKRRKMKNCMKMY